MVYAYLGFICFGLNLLIDTLNLWLRWIVRLHITETLGQNIDQILAMAGEVSSLSIISWEDIMNALPRETME